MPRRKLNTVTKAQSLTGRRTVTTPAILRQRKLITIQVRKAERLLHKIGELTAKWA